MIKHNYDAMALLEWLKDESLNQNSFQKYPSSIEAQSYLPMSFIQQLKALEYLESSGFILLDRTIPSIIKYKVDIVAVKQLMPEFDLFYSDDDSAQINNYITHSNTL
jgi:hypothetical protein